VENIYNRLVRDNIPDICISNNQKSKFRELDDLKYVSALNEELKEETKEYLADNSIDELIIGVIEALAITKGSNLDEV
jgi:predicted house-cleaning noncanonical NTP pyrophosphatase (MazG superfamily)